MPYPLRGPTGYTQGTNRVYAAGITFTANGTAALPSMNWASDPDNGPYHSGVANRTEWSSAGADNLSFRSGQLVSYNAHSLVGAVTASSTVTIGAAGYLVLTETTAPGNGGTNEVRIYAVVDGGAKTDLVAIFQTGAVQAISGEP